MKQFNKYDTFTELRQIIRSGANLYSRVADENDQDSLTVLHGYIDNACIYYADCWSYAMNCNNDFDIDQRETANNIQILLLV